MTETRNKHDTTGWMLGRSIQFDSFFLFSSFVCLFDCLFVCLFVCFKLPSLEQSVDLALLSESLGCDLDGSFVEAILYRHVCPLLD